MNRVQTRGTERTRRHLAFAHLLTLCLAASAVQGESSVEACPVEGGEAAAANAAALSLQCVSNPSPQTIESMDGHSAPQTVYHWRQSVYATGETRTEVLVDDAARWASTHHWQLDLTTLRDDADRRYQLVADASQASEDDPVVYEFRLVHYEPTWLTEAERRASFFAAHPEASAEAFEALDRHLSMEPQPEPLRVAEDVLNWLATATEEQTLSLLIRLRDDRSPPAISERVFQFPGAAEQEGANELAARRARIEARQAHMAELQAPVLTDLEAGGGHVRHSLWLVNAIVADLPAPALAELLEDPRIAQVETVTVQPDGNTLADMRGAAQVDQYHDAGFRGEMPSGTVCGAQDVVLAVIDSEIDTDHPAWQDTSAGTSRLVGAWKPYSTPSWSFWAPWVNPSPSKRHGTNVAGNAVGDLSQGQDGSILFPPDQEARTALATEASLLFVSWSDGFCPAIEKAVAEGTDVIVMSGSDDNPGCELASTMNDCVDAAMLEGVFFAKSGGNNGIYNGSCNVGTPAAASGAFSVNALARGTSPIRDAVLANGSTGGDAHGRSVIALSAWGGPQDPTTASPDDDYDSFGMTSSATPVVGGSAALLKEHLVDAFRTSLLREAGFLYASMLLMGDGSYASSTTAPRSIARHGRALDPDWGAGRLRMRLFNAQGMDTPWRMRMFSRTLDHGERAGDLLVNPNSFGRADDVPDDSETLRAAAWWHEPNIEDSTYWNAQINFQACPVSTSGCWSSGNPADPRQRQRIDNAGGSPWRLVLDGLSVPHSLDADHYFLQPTRKVFVSMYFEDADRDDRDGPAPAIR